MTTIACLITSNLTRAEAPGNVLLEPGEGNLNRVSVVNVSQIVTVDKTELSERVGRLPAARVAAIERGLHLLFDRAHQVE
ncbi:MAG: type II toxin-antitoxin system PemK/MazF family toxin [Bryobacteraceae bacterium]